MIRRLYLDTADIIAIADGNVNQEVVSDLLATMEATGTRLVVSREHVLDGTTNVDAATVERFEK